LYDHELEDCLDSGDYIPFTVIDRRALDGRGTRRSSRGMNGRAERQNICIGQEVSKLYVVPAADRRHGSSGRAEGCFLAHAAVFDGDGVLI
jgi:hypothetical protein